MAEFRAPPDRAAHQRASAQAAATGRSERVASLLRADGSVLQIAAHVTALDQTTFLGIFRDVSAAEEQREPRRPHEASLRRQRSGLSQSLTRRVVPQEGCFTTRM